MIEEEKEFKVDSSVMMPVNNFEATGPINLNFFKETNQNIMFSDQIQSQSKKHRESEYPEETDLEI